MSESILDFVVVTPATVVVVEILLRIEIRDRIDRLWRQISRSLHVIRSRRISNVWKEIAVPQYARKIMLQTARLVSLLIALVVIFCTVYYITGMLIMSTEFNFFEKLLSVDVHVFALSIGILYVLARRKMIHV